jgi:hypothetical protein
MSEKPIVFSTPMVRTILNTKPGVWPVEPVDPSKPYQWMTRRVVKPQPKYTLAAGNILWVRETFAKVPESGGYIYRADPMFDDCDKGDFAWDWTPSTNMPRKAARIFLEIKDIRTERLQEIMNSNALAEGMTARLGNSYGMNLHAEYDINKGNNAIAIFSRFWDTLNAKRGYSWESNPVVWVIEFRRIER